MEERARGREGRLMSGWEQHCSSASMHPYKHLPGGSGMSDRPVVEQTAAYYASDARGLSFSFADESAPMWTST